MACACRKYHEAWRPYFRRSKINLSFHDSLSVRFRRSGSKSASHLHEGSETAGRLQNASTSRVVDIDQRLCALQLLLTQLASHAAGLRPGPDERNKVCLTAAQLNCSCC